MFGEVLFVVVNIHPAALHEEPELPSTIVLEVVILFEFGGQVHHAGREKSLPKSLDILNAQLELVADQGLVEVRAVEDVKVLLSFQLFYYEVPNQLCVVVFVSY